MQCMKGKRAAVQSEESASTRVKRAPPSRTSAALQQMPQHPNALIPVQAMDSQFEPDRWVLRRLLRAAGVPAGLVQINFDVEVPQN